jgi:uncharacterized OB-fold protein
MATTEVSGRGEIDALTYELRPPPGAAEDAPTPYPIAAVQLEEQPGLRFTATVVGAQPADLSIGARVALDWIDRRGVPVPVFRLVS